MQLNSHNSAIKDIMDGKVFSGVTKADLSSLLKKNISIAALIAVITFTLVSSFIVASNMNSNDQNNNLQPEKNSES